MAALTTGTDDREALRAALAQPDKRLVVCLCAAWCDTCEEFKATFDRLAEADSTAAYLWLDIEDESELVGEVDIENFPTIAVYRGSVPVFLGVTLPQQALVARTLAALASRSAPAAVPPAISALPGVLKNL